MKFLEGITKIDITVMVKKLDDQKLKHNIKRQPTLIGNTECFTRVRQDQYWININNFNANATPNYIKLDAEIDKSLVAYTFKQVYKNKYSLVINTNQLQLYLTKDKTSAKEVLDMETNFENIKKIFNELSELGFELEESKSVNYIRLAKSIDEDIMDYKEPLRVIALSNPKGLPDPNGAWIKIKRFKKEAKTPSNPEPSKYINEIALKDSFTFYGAMQIKVLENKTVVTSELRYQDFHKMAKKLKLENNTVDFEKLFTDKKYVSLLEKMALDNISYVFKNVHKQIDENVAVLTELFNKCNNKAEVISAILQSYGDEKTIGYIDNLVIAKAVQESTLVDSKNYKRYVDDLFATIDSQKSDKRDILKKTDNVIERINTIGKYFNIKKYDIKMDKRRIKMIKNILN